MIQTGVELSSQPLLLFLLLKVWFWRLTQRPGRLWYFQQFFVVFVMVPGFSH